jgi:glycosyltransferase involved in cell wall biosynthesis
MARIFFIHGNRGAKFRQILECGGHEIEGVDFGNITSRIGKFAALWRATQRRAPVDVVIADDHGYFAFSAFLASLILRCPYFVRLRGDNWDEAEQEWCNLRGLARWRRRISRLVYIRAGDFALRRARAIVPVSEFLKDRALRNLRVSDGRFAVIPVPCAMPAAVAQRAAKARIVMLMVTNFNFIRKVEAIRHFGSAIERLLADHPDLDLQIAGDGLYLGNIRKSFDRWIAAGRVEFLGYRRDVASLFNNVDIFLHLSFQDAFPNVVVEAQAHGVPTVVNDFGGMLEQVAPDESGVVVSGSRPDSLYTAVSRLLADTAFAQRLRRSAPGFVASKFSLVAAAQRFDQLMADL